ncbi:FAD-binding protein [Candidatus Desantisbacteria bacterium]|nr:FAD-binding protein [Candidatus Desantisbacteria bacterium]
MSPKLNFDVIVIGAGPAGITAGVGLAKQGLAVALIEGAIYPGAENWSGCVYFTENIARQEIFGDEIINNAPFERKVSKRGMFITDGTTTLGKEISSDKIFKNSMIVLRPVFDRYLAERAKEFGVIIFPETHVQNLLKRDGRIIGVNTERGPVYSKVVFLAEGDASELVRKEGYETCAEPSFMQGIKLVIKMPQNEIEERFKLKDNDGAAYEILLRNANIGGATVPLNIGGFLYTNRDSVSLGLIISINNLKQYFNGSHDLLIEWYRSLPFIQNFISGGILTSYGVKIIRSGGWKQRPNLVDNGLVIGGASAEKGESFSTASLTNEYVDPLFNSIYALNSRYLENWPSYLENTRAFFETYIDLPLGWTNINFAGNMNVLSRTLSRARLLYSLFPPSRWKKIKKDTGALKIRLKFNEIRKKIKPSFFIILINTFNEIAAIFSRSDIDGLRIFIFNKEVPNKKLPLYIRWRLKIFEPFIKRAMSLVYENNDVTTDEKLKSAGKMVLGRISFVDIIGISLFTIYYSVLIIFVI